MHTRTAFNGTHTAVLLEDQLGSTPDGSASVTLQSVACAVGDTHHHGTRRKAQVAVGLFEIPLGLFAGLVGQVSLEKVQEINCLLVQFRKL